MFWILATAITLLIAGFLLWPLVQAGGRRLSAGLVLWFAAPIVILALYQWVGTPTGIHVAGQPDAPSLPERDPGGPEEIEQLVMRLEQRLHESPEDVDGWLLLGRTYKTLQRYDQAEASLKRAYDLAPERALVLVEFAEAKLFASGEPSISVEITDLLARALQLDPLQQKGLWLMGIAAAQAGNNVLALEYWQTLAGQLDPGSPVRSSLEQQMGALRDAGAPVPSSSTPSGAGVTVDAGTWQGLTVTVSANAGVTPIPAGAVLFIILRDPERPGPPLGVERVGQPKFPLEVFISDANSMMDTRRISSAAQVDVLARLSLSGSPTAQPGDIESDSMRVNLGQTQEIRLELETP